jgi:O-succinylbenzoic acid--CoA ligase
LSTLSIFDAAREASGAPALIAAQRSYTFAELAERCRPLFEELQRSPKPCWPLTPRADVDSLLCLYAAFASETPVLTLHLRAPDPERHRLSELAQAATARGALVLIPTSGSTGEPRLVELSRAAVVASARASAANLGWQPDDAWLLCLPLAHAGGLSIITRCLLARKPVVLFDGGESGALAQLAELARMAERATLLSLVPSLLEGLLDGGFRPSPRLRAVLLGGAACSPALARRAHAAGLPLLTSYGLTETASQVVTRRYAERFEPLPERDGAVSSGHALPGVELELRDGLVAVRAPSLLSRYAGDSAAPLDARGFFVTSDRASLGPAGELFVHGRADHVIITGGENVDPLEVEAALRELPRVRDACVFGTPSPQFGQVVSALLVTADEALADPTNLAKLLENRLARHQLPRRVQRTEALPLTASGKLDRAACLKLWEAKARAE